MNRTDAFAHDLCRYLNEKTGDSYQWTPAWRPPDKQGHESVDAGGEPKRKNGKLILIEAELRRDAPLTNAVKIWKWSKQQRVRSSFILVQAFSRYYGPKDSKRQNAEFVGHEMAQYLGVRYIPVSFSYKPYKHGKVGAGRRHHHAELLAARIIRRLHL